MGRVVAAENDNGNFKLTPVAGVGITLAAELFVRNDFNYMLL